MKLSSGEPGKRVRLPFVFTPETPHGPVSPAAGSKFDGTTNPARVPTGSRAAVGAMEHVRGWFKKKDPVFTVANWLAHISENCPILSDGQPSYSQRRPTFTVSFLETLMSSAANKSNALIRL